MPLNASPDPPPEGEAWYHTNPPAYRVHPWFGPWMMLAIVLAIIVAGYVLTASVAQWAASSQPGPGGPSSQPPAPERLVRLLTLTQTVWLVLALVIAGWPRAAAMSLRARLKGAAALGAPVQGPRAYAVACIVVVGMLTTTFGLVLGTGWTWLLQDLQSGAQLVRSSAWPLTFVLFVVCAPLAEEMLFRGLLTASLASTRFGFWPGAMIANVLWTSMHLHYSAVGLTEIAVVGLLFSALLAWSGSLRVTIFAHALYNGLLFLIVRFVPLPI